MRVVANATSSYQAVTCSPEKRTQSKPKLVGASGLGGVHWVPADGTGGDVSPATVVPLTQTSIALPDEEV
jgi:hypothetical protein